MKKSEGFNFDDVTIKKSEMGSVKGGTSTTLYKEVGFYIENEYEDTNGNGKLDDDEVKNVKEVDFGLGKVKP